jgi:hypothetical protein
VQLEVDLPRATLADTTSTRTLSPSEKVRPVRRPTMRRETSSKM